MVRINFQTREKNGCKCNARWGELSEFFSHFSFSPDKKFHVSRGKNIIY